MRNTICLNARRDSPGNGIYALGYYDRADSTQPTGKSLRKLTTRQMEILGLLAKGFYYKEIADALDISPFTVRAHLHTVYRKLDVKSRARAVVRFQELVRKP